MILYTWLSAERPTGRARRSVECRYLAAEKPSLVGSPGRVNGLARLPLEQPHVHLLEGVAARRTSQLVTRFVEVQHGKRTGCCRPARFPYGGCDEGSISGGAGCARLIESPSLSRSVMRGNVGWWHARLSRRQRLLQEGICTRCARHWVVSPRHVSKRFLLECIFRAAN